MPGHCSREETREKQSPANPTKGKTAYSTAGHPEELQHAPLCLLALGLRILETILSFSLLFQP